MFKAKDLAGSLVVVSLACLLAISCCPCFAEDSLEENAVTAISQASYNQYADTSENLPSPIALDPLPSWNEGSAKNSIISFVTNVTNESNSDYVEPDDRIATFDNDGTLWCEYPDYVPPQFIFYRIKEMAPQHPEWNYTEPFSSILSGERLYSSNLSAKESMLIYVTTSLNLTADEYMSLAADWLNQSRDPRFGLPYTKCVYKPMLELLDYLRAEGFKIYIVTGGDQDFVRSFSEEVYGIPNEQVIGSAMKLKFIENNSSCSLVKLPEILVFDDGQKKAEEIQLIIGQRPIFAYGNSDGDIPMLQYTTGGNRQGIGLLNRHDDPVREYAYDNLSTIGSLDKGLEMAGEWGWHIVSMKDDWKCLF
jgi:hypothetical protein